MRRLGPLYGGAVAIVHSTPLKWDALGEEARSPGWVVALGLPIGMIAYIVAVLARLCGFPLPIAALLGLATLTVASAGLIERGVVDRLDRAADTTSPTVTAILVLIFLTLIRAAAIIGSPPSAWLGIFVATAITGRWAAVFLQSLGDPILDDRAPRSLVATPAPLWLTAALSAGVLALDVVGLGKAGVVVIALAAAIVFGLGLDAQRRDHGLSSPIVACAAAVGEVMVLLLATLRA